MTHSSLIERIDTVRAYYSGPRLVAEVDIVIDRNERLEVAHDVAEDLQVKLEKLPSIERAFVHIDYETNHKPVSSCCCNAPDGDFALPIIVGTRAQAQKAALSGHRLNLLKPLGVSVVVSARRGRLGLLASPLGEMLCPFR